MAKKSGGRKMGPRRFACRNLKRRFLDAGPTLAGVAENSRGLSGATPPDMNQKWNCTPAGVPELYEIRPSSKVTGNRRAPSIDFPPLVRGAGGVAWHGDIARPSCQSRIQRFCDPSGVGFNCGSPIRGCRFARPPANGCHPCRGAGLRN